MSEFGRLAEDIVNWEIDYLTGTEKNVAISRASGWFSSNIGKLNTLIYSSYDGENPGLKYEEASIYKTMYMSQFYRSKAASVLKNMDSGPIQWISMAEGDSRVQLQNKNEVAKTYNHMAKEASEALDKLVWAYNLYAAYPREVAIICTDVGVGVPDSEFSVQGFVDIPVGANSVFVPAYLGSDPSKISISLVKPSGENPNFSYSVVGSSICNSGFMVGLGATVNQGGYRINYGVK